ncbi:MAG: HEAT repeat domain-containing protein [Bdellovibrionia bacterium]
MSFKKRTWIFIFGWMGFVWVFFEASSWALSRAELRESIESTISMRHPQETGEWWQSLGPSAPEVMIEMIQSETRVYRKIRLLDGLAWFDDPKVVEFLKHFADAHPDTILAQSALSSLARSQGEKERKFLEKGLNSADPGTRAHTVHLLEQMKAFQMNRKSQNSLGAKQELNSQDINPKHIKNQEFRNSRDPKLVPGRIQRPSSRFF